MQLRLAAFHQLWRWAARPALSRPVDYVLGRKLREISGIHRDLKHVPDCISFRFPCRQMSYASRPDATASLKMPEGSLVDWTRILSASSRLALYQAWAS